MPKDSNRILLLLDDDPDSAARKYHILRDKLKKQLASWSSKMGKAQCEDLADEAILRVIENLNRGEQIGDLFSYCRGVARNVFREHLRGPDSKTESFEELEVNESRFARAYGIEGMGVTEERERAWLEKERCWEKCLKEVENGELFIRYYKAKMQGSASQENSRMAEEMGKSIGALSTDVSRLRRKVEECCRRCINETHGRDETEPPIDHFMNA